jgi:hypothetical protein
MTRSFQIVWMRPPGYVFAEGSRELVNVLRDGLAAIGLPAPVFENSCPDQGTPIVVGSHHILQHSADRLPPDTILYNLEQLIPGYPRHSEAYLSLLRRFRVWDLYQGNVDYLRSNGVNAEVHQVPMGYMPQLTNIPAAAEDIDVLFYGVPTPRRSSVVQKLRDRGLKVFNLSGVFGAGRDHCIARAKVVLNLHQEDTGYFESIRVIHLMANRKAVVTEAARPAELDTGLAGGLCAAGYDQLVDSCERLVLQAWQRQALADAAFDAVAQPQMRMSSILKRIPEIRAALGEA